MPREPLRIALTGGIASGKSYCLRRFADLGVPVIDADELAHGAIAPGTAGFDRVVARFGPSMVGPTGTIDRSRLGPVVFADEAARHDLEAIVHPVVRAAIDAWFRALEAGSAGGRLGIADVPLLYETHGDAHYDRVIVAACGPDAQRMRLDARGLSDTDIAQRLAAQLPLAEKARRADYLIDTTGRTDETDRQVIEVLERLSAEAAVND